MSKAGRADVQIPSVPGRCGNKRGNVDLDMSRLVLNPAGIPGCPACLDRNAVYFSWHCEFRWRKAAYVMGVGVAIRFGSRSGGRWPPACLPPLVVFRGPGCRRVCRPLIPASSVELMMGQYVFRECQNSIGVLGRVLGFYGVGCAVDLVKMPLAHPSSGGDSLDPPPEGTDMTELRPSFSGIDSQF